MRLLKDTAIQLLFFDFFSNKRQEEFSYSKSKEAVETNHTTKKICISGRDVTLTFCDRPDPSIWQDIRSILLSSQTLEKEPTQHREQLSSMFDHCGTLCYTWADLQLDNFTTTAVSPFLHNKKEK